MKMKSYNLITSDNIAQFQFNNINDMIRYIEPISIYIEGNTKDTRIGHNFSIENFWKYVSSLKVHTKEIKEIIDVVKKQQVKYIIAYISGDIQTKKHELQHAKFHIDEHYRLSIYDKWNNLDKKTQNHIISFLKRLGYPDEVIIDEFQAYYMTEKHNFFGVRIN
jgi:hypothetical protein